MIISYLQLFICHRLRPVELPPFELLHGGRRDENDERHQIRILQDPQTLRVQIEDADLLGEDDRTNGLERGPWKRKTCFHSNFNTWSDHVVSLSLSLWKTFLRLVKFQPHGLALTVVRLFVFAMLDESSREDILLERLTVDEVIVLAVDLVGTFEPGGV